MDIERLKYIRNECKSIVSTYGLSKARNNNLIYSYNELLKHRTKKIQEKFKLNLLGAKKRQIVLKTPLRSKSSYKKIKSPKFSSIQMIEVVMIIKIGKQ